MRDTRDDSRDLLDAVEPAPVAVLLPGCPGIPQTVRAIVEEGHPLIGVMHVIDRAKPTLGRRGPGLVAISGCVGVLDL